MGVLNRALRGVRLPTQRHDWQLMSRTARLVLTLPTYALIAVIAGVISLTAFVVSLNVPVFMDLVVGGTLPLSSRLAIVGELYPFVGTNFTVVQGLLLVVVALLTGTDIAMATYHFREHGFDIQQGGAGAAGMVLGTLGAGCAACGSAVMVGLLSLVGVSASVLFLPLDGLEFALGAVVVLTLSIYWLADGMRGGEINGCPVDI